MILNVGGGPTPDKPGALSLRLATGRTMELVNDLTIVAARVLIATDSFLAGTGKTNKERR